MTRWTGEQFALLVADYPNHGAAALRNIGKSETSIRLKAWRSGIKRVSNVKTFRGKMILMPPEHRNGRA